MRSIVELLTTLESKVKERAEKSDGVLAISKYGGAYKPAGLCAVTALLQHLGDITPHDRVVLDEYISNNAPGHYKEWVELRPRDRRLTHSHKHEYHWWKPGETSERLGWLDKHIELNK